MDSLNKLYNQQGMIINELVKCFREHQNISKDLAKKIDYFFRVVNESKISDKVRYDLISNILPWLMSITINNLVK